MAKNIGAYRGYGCTYEKKEGTTNTFILVFYRYGYKFQESFRREISGYEHNLNYVSRRIIDLMYKLKKEKRYGDLPDFTLVDKLTALPK